MGNCKHCCSSAHQKDISPRSILSPSTPTDMEFDKFLFKRNMIELRKKEDQQYTFGKTQGHKISPD